MKSQVLDPVKAVALDHLVAAIDEVQAAGVSPLDAADARVLIGEVEVQARRLFGEQVAVLDEVDRRGLHRVDGHASAKVMVRHEARLSNSAAARRAQVAKALRELPVLAASVRAGRIGPCQVQRVAQAYANPRVRALVVASDAAFAEKAETVGYRLFDLMVANWVDQMDQDGPGDHNQRCHESRDFKLLQDYDKSWVFGGGCAALQGAEMANILEQFTKAETLADWERARAEHGDAVTDAHLARTDAQRRSDACFEIFRRAASHRAANGGSMIVTDIVIDHATFERLAATFFGAAPTEANPPVFGEEDGYRCSTLDGRPLDPTEAVARTLVGEVRRVVIGADGVTIDLGRRRRLFTGPAALAVRLADTECYWPGCHVPVSNCQIDHLLPWADHGGEGGRTDPGNGGPACGRHNRLKEHGYSVWRDPNGRWHTHRPDGTEIT